MSLLERIGCRLSRIEYARKALEEPADLSVFRKRPKARMLFGVGLIAISFPLGWPAVGAFLAAAIRVGKPLLFVIGGPAAYGFSWLVWSLGMYFAGVEGMRYAEILLRWAIATVLRKMIDQGTNNSSEGSAGPDSSDPSRRR